MLVKISETQRTELRNRDPRLKEHPQEGLITGGQCALLHALSFSGENLLASAAQSSLARQREGEGHWSEGMLVRSWENTGALLAQQAN